MYAVPMKRSKKVSAIQTTDRLFIIRCRGFHRIAPIVSAHDYLRQRDTQGDYQQAVRRVVDIVFDHVTTIRDISVLSKMNDDEPNDILEQWVVLADARTLTRIVALIDETRFASAGSAQYRGNIDYIAMAAEIKPPDATLDDELADSLTAAVF